MQQQVSLHLICPKHGEEITSVSLTETGENQMLCQKCLTHNLMTIDQLAQQLADLNQKKIQNLIENVRKSDKRLQSIQKLILTIKERFNQKIDNILKSINDEMSQMNQSIKQECEQLQQPIQQLNITQVNAKIIDLKKQEQLQDDLFNNKDKTFINQIIIQYLELAKQINELIRQDCVQKKKNELFKNQNIVKKNNINQQKIQEQINVSQYITFFKKGLASLGFAMAMDKDEKILISSAIKYIEIWAINSDGTIQSKNKQLNEHTDTINTLCFSQKEQWFISGSFKRKIVVWKKSDNDCWISQQIIENAHNQPINQILLNNEEDQIISSSRDCIIKVWMKQRDNALWQCFQILFGHPNDVLFLSFSPNFNLLASSGKDALRIWQIDNDRKWHQYQVIESPNNDIHLRIKLIDNNELIASTKNEGRLLRYTLNNKGLFKLQSELKLSQSEERDTESFGLIYNKLLGIVILKHTDDHIYILKQQPNGEFVKHQVLNGHYDAAYLWRNGKYLILQDAENSLLEVLKQ